MFRRHLMQLEIALHGNYTCINSSLYLHSLEWPPNGIWYSMSIITMITTVDVQKAFDVVRDRTSWKLHMYQQFSVPSFTWVAGHNTLKTPTCFCPLYTAGMTIILESHSYLWISRISLFVDHIKMQILYFYGIDHVDIVCTGELQWMFRRHFM